MTETAAATGVHRIAETFDDARADGRAALMPYMMGAFPDPEGAGAIAAAYADSGADLIELGIPFSDPLADGPVIHAAATAALEKGATLDSALEACSAVAEQLPVVAMVYSNMILALGEAEFAGKLADAGAAGAIVPDLPLEEQGGIRVALSGRGLALVPLIAPTTPDERRREICAAAEGFVYVVSTVGVTGEREALPRELTELITAAKQEAPVPVAVGFGISTPEQAARVGELADGIIIGSRLVRAISEAPDLSTGLNRISSFLREVSAELAG
jgi:tryptophan synthase alpha chain